MENRKQNRKLSPKEKRANFVKYSNIRLANAIRAISLLGNLANKRAYEYETRDVETIKKVLRKAITEMEASFTAKSKDNIERDFIK